MSLTLDQLAGRPSRPAADQLPTPSPQFSDIVRALRPKQWVKNLLLFGALFGSGQIISVQPVLANIVGFVAFCAAASAVYLLNDVMDRGSDALHPVKRLRPIASGLITPTLAGWLAGVLGVAALGLAATQNLAFMALIATYLLLQVAYCLWLRSQQILDIITVATGFLLRAIGGGVVAGIDLTPWFLAVVGFGALFVVTGKRASEVTRVHADESGRHVVQLYTPTFLRTVGMMALTITVVTYCLWAFARYESGAWLLAISVVPFVVAVLRYAQVVDSGLAEAPEQTLLSDRLIRMAGLVWALLFTANALLDSWDQLNWAVLRYAATIAVVVAIGYTGWLTSWRLGLRRVSELLCGMLVVGTAEIILLSLTIGQIPGGFRPLPLGLAVAALALVAHFVAGRDAGRSGLRLTLATLRHLAGYPRRHLLITLFALLLAIGYGARLIVVLRLPIMDYDGLWYHLIGPDQWIIDGQVTRPEHVIWSAVYPSNMELVMAWPGVFLRSMWFATLALVPYAALGAIAVIGIARRLGAKRPMALLAGLTFAAVPSVISWIGTSYVDISLAACVLGGAFLLLGIGSPGVAKRAPIGRIVVAGMAIGIATGTKTSGLVSFGVLTGGLALWLLWLRFKGQITGWRKLLVAFCLPVAMLGAFWYLRTWVVYGNPFYPVSILGFPGNGTVDELFMGRNTPKEIQDAGGPFGALWYSWLEDFVPRHEVYWARLGGMGAFWMPIVLPAALAGLVLTLRRKAAAGLILLALALAVMVSSPAAWWPRYVLITVGIAAAFAAVSLSRIPRWPARIVVAALVAASTFSNMGVVQDPAVPLALSQNPDHTKVFGWDRFQDYDRIPTGSTIGWVPVSKEALLHPMVGMDLERRVVALRPTSDLTALAAELARNGATYLVLDEEHPLHGLVRDAPDQYRRIPVRADADFDWPIVYKHRLYMVLNAPR